MSRATPPASASGPQISVIVPHYQDLANLDHCLTALTRQTLPREKFEIVVADNASPAGVAEVAALIAGRARLVVADERGAGAARNAGVDVANGLVLAFTDADCRPEPGWLEAGAAALGEFDLVGGRMEVLCESATARTGPEAFETVFAFRNEDYVKRKGFSVTANLFCRRSTFDAVGPFATSGVSEDTEWCLRARDLGFSIGFAPDAAVGHPARRTWQELVRKFRRIDEESFQLSLSRGGSRLAWLARSVALPISAAVHTPRALMSQQLSSGGERARAVSTLWAIRIWRTGDCLRLLVRNPVSR
ncbi:MAG TPA: glycosyltransferase [Caulobacteraceae bacterium]|jgi:GT2 family glycosyltransferase|nr:glycosyltransferase [Caulobacteraceae bacterium]